MGGAVTVILTDLAILPPSPEQVRVNVDVSGGATVAEPLNGLVPLHAPEPVHVSAFELAHVRILVSPSIILAGCALRVNAGGGLSGVTLTVTDLAALPDALVHVNL